MRIAPLVVIIMLGIRALAAGANPEPVPDEKAVSPDHAMVAIAKWREGDDDAGCELTVRAGTIQLYHDPFLKGGVRDVRFSWAPDSRALLVCEYCKGVTNLLLIRFEKGKAPPAYFDCDDAVNGPMLDHLPFQRKLQIFAPIAHVAQHTVQWDNQNHCDMIYVFRGIGYEGEASLRIDWDKHDPKLNVVKISPILNPKNLDDF